MRIGVYRKKNTVTLERPSGLLYQIITVARNHYDGAQAVIYIPLRVEPEWEGTIRPCWIPRGDFEAKFEYVGEGLPTPVERQ